MHQNFAGLIAPSWVGLSRTVGTGVGPGPGSGTGSGLGSGRGSGLGSGCSLGKLSPRFAQVKTTCLGGASRLRELMFQERTYTSRLYAGAGLRDGHRSGTGGPASLSRAIIDKMNVFGYQCKTRGCPAWLKMGDLPEDSARSIHFPINLGTDPIELTCPDCLQTHKYYFAEKEIRKVVP